MNNGDGTFEDVSTRSNTALGIFAMCVTVGDYDNDGWQDIYVTNTTEGNALLHNKGTAGEYQNVMYEEIANELGLGFYGIGWGSSFLDADNDGDLDLYVSGSLTGTSSTSSVYYENNDDGTFFIPSIGFADDTVASYSNAIGDYNNDGYPEIIVINTSPHASQLWSTDSGQHRWIKILLEGVLSSRDGVGSRIEIYTPGKKQSRYTHCGSGFLGQNSSTEIIGVGSFDKIDSIHITWLSGHIDKLYDVAVNQKLHIQEGSTTDGRINFDPNIMDVVSDTKDLLLPSIPVLIYPNPVGEIINIERTHKDLQHFEIYNFEGVKLVSDRILSKKVQIQVSDFPPGIYLISVIDNHSNRYTIKWIKI